MRIILVALLTPDAINGLCRVCMDKDTHGHTAGSAVLEDWFIENTIMVPRHHLCDWNCFESMTGHMWVDYLIVVGHHLHFATMIHKLAPWLPPCPIGRHHDTN